MKKTEQGSVFILCTVICLHVENSWEFRDRRQIHQRAADTLRDGIRTWAQHAVQQVQVRIRAAIPVDLHSNHSLPVLRQVVSPAWDVLSGRPFWDVCLFLAVIGARSETRTRCSQGCTPWIFVPDPFRPLLRTYTFPEMQRSYIGGDSILVAPALEDECGHALPQATAL